MLYTDMNLADSFFFIDINNKILNYLKYPQEKVENSKVKQSLKISVDLYHNGPNSFYSSLKKMTDYSA